MNVKPGVILVILALIAVGVFGGMAILTTGGSWTEGEVEHHKGWEFLGEFTNGRTHFATSHLSNGNSEDITFQGRVRYVDWFTTYDLEEIRYKAYYEGGLIKSWPADGTWFDLGTMSTWPWKTGDWYYTPAWTFNMQGEVVGRLEVVMEARMQNMWPPWNVWEGNAARDGAFLESGRGEIYIYGSQETFEEGETAPIFVRTGFTNGAGWTVKLYPPPDRSDLSTTTITTLGDDTQRIVDIEIQPGWFKPNGINIFTVELWNHLFDVGFTHIISLDQHARQPGTPTFTHDADGGSLTVTATAESTYATITEFWVWAWYGDFTMPSMSDGESWIIYNQHNAATQPTGNNYTTTFTVNAKNKDGNVMIKVVARDGDGRSSEPAYLSAIVVDGSFEKVKTPTKQAFLWSLMVYMVILLGLLISALLLIRSYMAGSIEMGVVWFAVGMVITFIIAYIVGATPSLALLLG